MSAQYSAVGLINNLWIPIGSPVSMQYPYSPVFILLRAKEISSVDHKFYQKLFVVLISLFSILIFPESPRELENICLNHYDRELCKVW